MVKLVDESKQRNLKFEFKTDSISRVAGVTLDSLDVGRVEVDSTVIIGSPRSTTSFLAWEC